MQIEEPIEVRDLAFTLPLDVPHNWHGTSLSISLFWNGMSIFFPHGEKFFVTSVLHHSGAVVDPALAEAVRLFCRQEGIHSREHTLYNQMLSSQGYPEETLKARVQWMYRWVNRLTSKRMQLAATAAMEHFTAILGDMVLEHPETFADAHPRMAALWRWHAAEEVEHKCVAYDVYLAAGGHYPERVGIMLLTTFIYVVKVLEHQTCLMRHAGILRSSKEWSALVKYLFNSPWSRPLLKSYFSYYIPGFHPSQIDDVALLERWKAGLQQEYQGYAKRPKVQAAALS